MAKFVLGLVIKASYAKVAQVMSKKDGFHIVWDEISSLIRNYLFISHFPLFTLIFEE